MKKALAIGLLFINFNCFGSLFENEPDPFIGFARFPVLVHLCNKADVLEKPDIKKYIATALFGEDWEKQLQVARLAVASDSFPQIPPPAYGIVERRIDEKACQEERKDVSDFLHKNSATDEEKFNTWPTDF